MHLSVQSRRLTFTREGKIYSSLCIAVGIAAINTGSNLLFLVLGMMLSIIVTSGIISETGFRQISIRRNLPDHIKCMETTPLRYEIRNGKKLFPSFCIFLRDSVPGKPEMFIPKIGPGERISAISEISFPRRGRINITSFTIGTSYPFGFFEKEKKAIQESAVIVFPVIKKVSGKNLNIAEYGSFSSHRINNLRNEAELFRGLREYRTGENPKLIHWKSAAKYQVPMLKEYESLPSSRVIVILDTLFPSGMKETEESGIAFESAVCLCASLVADLSQRKIDVSLSLLKRSETAFNVNSSSDKTISGILEDLALAEPDYYDTDPQESNYSIGNTISNFSSLYIICLTSHSENILRKKLTGRNISVLFFNMENTELRTHFYPY